MDTSIGQGLEDLYNEITQDIHGRSASLKLIQWICFAIRPLSLDELRWALAVDADCLYKSLQQCRDAEDYISDCDIMERRLKTLSHGLAEAVPSSRGRVVQFIHPSVRDFCVQKGLSALSSNLNEAEVDLVGIAHYRLSRTCVRYLAMEEIGQSLTNDPNDLIARYRLMSRFPLLHYATTSWVLHVKHSEERKVSQDDLLNYFAWPSEALMQLWVQVYKAIELDSDDCPAKGTTMIHIAAQYQLRGLLQVILQRADQVDADVDSKDKGGRTPLSWAARNGHEAVVQLLRRFKG
ncbi:hypothetical protein QBC46DRAFT_361980 [Diplogelasinospora grovesii]|uniref:GPI inositol-deacylase winged helix domain-containing protein n=1 Tax=Diplogelasinospora grovesii TaxID=303347 RepID=A0AAN6S7G2_9PEZI|nr:hypothetical protein QBC46DRAFT_361980 [Diplogelasinospora grovesii]